MSDITLVTGGTGTLGSLVVQKLRETGAATRVLSRHPGPDVAVGDLASGVGVDAALAGVSTVIHCATGKNDEKQSANLIAAARRAGVSHLVYISIVGVDRHPFAYYRAKYAVERQIEDSGLPFTILRATQFHNLVVGGLNAQRRSPLILVPDIPIQPVEVSEVAQRLVELSRAEPAGRVPDLGGPQIRRLRDLAALWRAASGRRRVLLPLVLPGKTFGAFSAGLHLAPEHADGTATFEQFLAKSVPAGGR
ncbi:MAG TPA: NAD(P)H-binding protein [Microbacteriaceae bacterium]